MERARTPNGAREWLSFEDSSEDRTWMVDVSFLESGWCCIYGNGCQGVLTEPAPELAQGCCSYGAHLTGPDDAERVETAAATLLPSQWQFRRAGLRRGTVRTTKAGESVTRLAGGACIFLNRPGFDGGPGCALHRAALERGVAPLELKPDVCWQLPLRREDAVAEDGHVTSTLTEWRRRNWGAGGRQFAWWCTEDPGAFRSSEPVYKSMRDELVVMLGTEIYGLIATYLDDRAHRRAVRLPHPVLRR
ncbi:MAG: hypothetical protein ACRD0B_05825 [Acidimicrobiales bacterium]